MQRFVTVLLLCLFFSCGFVKAPQQSVTTVADPEPKSPLHLYTEGVKLNAIYGDTTQARRLFRRAIEEDSTYAPAHYELATSILYDDPKGAISHAYKATTLDSTNRWYRQLYGQTLLVGRRYAEAIPIFENLVRTAPSPDHYRILAALYEQDKRPFSAIAILDSAEGQFGLNPYLSEMKRGVLLATHQFDRALAEAEKMVAHIPYMPENHIALGEIYALMKRDSLAAVSFHKALEIDPTNTMAWMALADHHQQRGDIRSYLNATYQLFKLEGMPLSEKISLFRRLTSNRRFYSENYTQIDILATTLHTTYPNDKGVTNLYASHLINSGKVADALTIYKEQCNDAKASKEPFLAVMEISNYLGLTDSVTHYLNRALVRFPKDAELYVRRAHIHLLNKEYDKATGSYREGLKHADNDTLRSTIWGYIGDLYHQLAVGENNITTEGKFGTRSTDRNERKQMERCYECYDKALQLHAENASVLNNYAYFLSLEERDLERALEMSDRCNSLTANNPTFLDTKAWILHKLGRNDEAKRIMRQAISLDATNSADLQLHYGDILAALGERFMAEVYWRKALDNGYDKPSIEQRIERLKKSK